MGKGSGNHWDRWEGAGRPAPVDLRRRTPKTLTIRKAVMIYLDKSDLKEKGCVTAHSSREDIVCHGSKGLAAEA